MPQYSDAVSLKPTGRVLVRITLTEEEALYLMRVTKDRVNPHCREINAKLTKAKRYPERVISRDV